MKKLVVITGASSEIGKTIAKQFSKNNNPVLLLSRRLDKMEELELTNSLYKSVDVTDLEKMKEAIK